MTDDNEKSPAYHGSVVEVAGKGILIRGASGAGKSSLALRFLDDAKVGGTVAHLIADDWFYLDIVETRLVATCPPQIVGIMEVRGIGIAEVAHKTQTKLDLIVDLVKANSFERCPAAEDLSTTLKNIPIPRLKIIERNPDAAAIVRFFLNHLAQSAEQKIISV